MPITDHGTRANYKRGCRCLPCRAANARYWTGWYHTRKAGKLPLGARISAHRMRIELRSLRGEYPQPGQLDALLGGHWNLHRLRKSTTVTLRTAMKVRRLYRQASFVWLDSTLTRSQAEIASDTLEGLGR